MLKQYIQNAKTLASNIKAILNLQNISTDLVNNTHFSYNIPSFALINASDEKRTKNILDKLFDKLPTKSTTLYYHKKGKGLIAYKGSTIVIHRGLNYSNDTNMLITKLCKKYECRKIEYIGLIQSVTFKKSSQLIKDSEVVSDDILYIGGLMLIHDGGNKFNIFEYAWNNINV